VARREGQGSGREPHQRRAKMVARARHVGVTAPRTSVTIYKRGDAHGTGRDVTVAGEDGRQRYATALVQRSTDAPPSIAGAQTRGRAPWATRLAQQRAVTYLAGAAVSAKLAWDDARRRTTRDENERSNMLNVLESILGTGLVFQMALGRPHIGTLPRRGNGRDGTRSRRISPRSHHSFASPAIMA